MKYAKKLVALLLAAALLFSAVPVTNAAETDPAVSVEDGRFIVDGVAYNYYIGQRESHGFTGQDFTAGLRTAYETVEFDAYVLMISTAVSSNSNGVKIIPVLRMTTAQPFVVQQNNMIV